MTMCRSSCDPVSALALGISNRRFHIWNLRFAICNPAGHAFAPEGLRLDRCFTANNPGCQLIPSNNAVLSRSIAFSVMRERS